VAHICMKYVTQPKATFKTKLSWM